MNHNRVPGFSHVYVHENSLVSWHDFLRMLPDKAVDPFILRLWYMTRHGHDLVLFLPYQDMFDKFWERFSDWVNGKGYTPKLEVAMEYKGMIGGIILEPVREPYTYEVSSHT